jgi:hypothetical protein
LAFPVLALAQAAVLVTVIGGVAAHRSRDDVAANTPSPIVTLPSRPITHPTTVAPATAASGLVNAAEAAKLERSLIIPVVGVVSSALHDNFSERRSGGRMHEALDIMAPRGTPVVSAVDGRLLKLHLSKAGGLMVYAADATDQFILMYAHLDRYADGLVEGAPLHKGQVLGYVGTTGNAPPNAPHLHFAIARGQPSVQWWKGVAVDPYPLLVNAPSSLAPTIQVAAIDDTAKSPPSSKASRADTAVATRPRKAVSSSSKQSAQKARTPTSSRTTRALAARAGASKKSVAVKSVVQNRSRAKG